MDPILNKNNIEDFLRFFEKKIGKKFDEDAMNRWRTLENDQLPQNVNKLLEHFGYDTDPQKMEVIREYILSTESTDTQTEPEPVSSPQTESGSMVDEGKMYTNETDTGRVASYYQEDESSGRSWGRIIFVILLISLIAGAAWLWAKYSEYNGRAQIYSLGDNINIRKDLNSDEVWPTRLYLFGRYRGTTDSQIHKTSTSLPLVDEELYNNYYKVYMDTSFTQYLLNGEKTVGYVHSKYVTRNATEYERYLDVFYHYEDDYEEMEQLPFEVRRILVHAIYNYGELKGKRLSPPCYKEPKPIKNAPMSVGIVDIKAGKAKTYYVVARIDGQYYTIKSNQEGSEIYVDRVTQEDGPVAVYMEASGKFEQAKGPNNYSGLKWTSCDKEQVLYAYYKPFNKFKPKAYSRPAPTPAPAPTSVTPDSDPQEDFIEDVNFSE